MDPQHTSRLTTLCARWLKASLIAWALLLAHEAHAYEVKLPNGEFIDAVVDMEVKVLGGSVRIARTWTNGRWYTNPGWASLRLIADPLDNSVKTIDRAGVFYERSGTSDLYIYEQVFIKKLESGWRWYNRGGDWATYDPDGRITGYGDRNDVRVNFVRNEAGELTTITDHFGKPVMSFSYENDLLTKVTDRAGRSVSYRWTFSGATARLTEVTDLMGNFWRYEYNSDGQITQRTAPDEGVVQLAYAASSAAGAPAMTSGKNAFALVKDAVVSTAAVPSDITLARVGTLKDELNQTTIWNTTWDRMARQYTVSKEEPDGRKTVNVYAKDGTLLKSTVNGNLRSTLVRDGKYAERGTDGRGLVTTTVYDTEQRPTEITYPDGTSERYTYDVSHGQKTSHTDEENVVTRWEYDTKGNMTRQIEAYGLPEERTTTWSYDAYGRMETRSVAGKNGVDAATVRYTYDDYGNIKSYTDAEQQTTTYTYSYDATGHTVEVKDALQFTTTTRYNAAGYRVSVTDALNRTTTYKTDPLGRVTEVKDPLEHPTAATYDKTGRRTSLTNVLNETTSYDYTVTPTGKSVKVIGPAPSHLTTTQVYNNDGRLMESIDAAGNTTRYEYGAPGSPFADLLTAIVHPTYRETYQYDPRGRLTATTQVLDAETRLTTTLGYSGSGRIISEVDPGGVTTLTRYDGLGRVIETIDNAGQKTTQSWDAHDNRLTLTDAMGNTHRFTYDRNGRVKTEQRPLGGTTTFEYDAVGNLKSRTDAAGNVWAYTYNGVRRRTKAVLTGKASSQTIDYAYNLAHELTGITQRGETESEFAYTLDPLGRTTQETITYGTGEGAIAKTLGNGYDENGQRRSLTYPDGTHVDYAYDKGQLTTVTLPNAEGIGFSGYVWRKPAQVTFPGSTKTLVYDALMRPKQIKLTNSVAVTLLDRTYHYDASGNIRQRDTEDGTFTYGYDRANRLTQVVPPEPLRQGPTRPDGLPVEGYVYDGVGNRVISAHQPGTWVYNADNQLVSWGMDAEQATLTYTENGHTETETKGTSTRTYRYNAADRLTEITAENVTVARYHYDPNGRRISKTVGGVTTYYLYADEGLVAELDGKGNLLQAYGWMPGKIWGTDPLWTAQLSAGQDLAAAAFNFLVIDHLGTPQVATDSGGRLTWKGLAEAFGRTRSAVAVGATINLRFPGQYFDAESGLHYNYFRGYRPAIGRYGEADPIGVYGGPNIYVYVDDSPALGRDPIGLKPGDEYESERAAAKRALSDINPRSIRENIEYAGMICELGCGGKFTYTAANPGGWDFAYPEQSPCSGGMKPVGTYHTHGAARKPYDDYFSNESYGTGGGGRQFSTRGDERFSDEDVANCRARRMDSYLATPRGRFHWCNHRVGVPTPIGDKGTIPIN